MSIPPQLIRVKRKRDNDAPVTFLQLDEGTKRHRSGRNWVYQRRAPTVTSAASAAIRRDSKPVIHVSEPGSDSSPSKKRDAVSTAAESPLPSKKRTADENLEPRKFHVSRAMLSQATSQCLIPGVSKPARHGPTLFVERGRRKIAPKTSRQNLAANQAQPATGSSTTAPGTTDGHNEPVEQQRLKKPGVASKHRSPSQDSTARNPLPPSLMNRHNEDMDKITADMNEWVLSEIGASLHSLEEEKKKESEKESEKQSRKPRFRPKVPGKRYQERHPQPAVLSPPPQVDAVSDTPMADASEEEGDDDDWVIEEYVRIPAHSMGVDVLPSDVGILVLDGEEENKLFYGPPQDEDDELAEDEEDENAENHYTADYPEDEVDSDDEFDRHAYMFRNGNASDDEEFDDEEYRSGSDDMGLEGHDDDDARMDRIREFMRRNAAFRS